MKKRKQKRPHTADTGSSDRKCEPILHAASEPSHPSFPIPERRSLIDQTLEAIRSRIEAGVWEERLPGERYFCELLQVSRPTVRSALEILEREGMISVVQGTNRVLNRAAAFKDNAVTDRHVVVLSPDSRSRMHPSALYQVDKMHTHLEKVGLGLSVESPAWLRYQNPEPYLEKYVAKSSASCWALFSVTEKVQRWFSKKGIPALVSGSCYEEVALPSVDFDYASVTHHAVSTLLGKGCKAVTLFVPGQLRPGDVTTLEAFKKATLHQPEVQSAVIRIAQEQKAFEQQLDVIMNGATGKQGLFVFNALRTLHMVTYLLKKGCRIGSDFAVISRDDDFYLEYLVPAPARYRLLKDAFANRFCKKLLQLAQTGNVGTRNTLIIPEFYAGETL